LIISQLFSLAQVANQAKDAYSQRLRDGREPPLVDPSQHQVVVRLAGRISDVTTLGMQRDGRRRYFPIFEESKLIQVQQLVRKHGLKVGTYGVPVFWQVDDGQYGHEDSWRGMRIPPQWLFDKEKQSSGPSKENGKILILEADATSGESMSLSLSHPKEMHELDLDLYEVAQGYYRLRRLVADDAPPHEVLNVLLVDADAIVKSGGGRTRSVREYVTNLGLADVIIDARAPLLFSINSWLEKRSWDDQYLVKPSLFFWCNRHKKKPVILETPSATCFDSIKAALDGLGYAVMDMSDAVNRYGSTFDIPILVYERTTQDTIHTIRRLVKAQDTVRPDNVCALCPTHHGLVELKPGESSPIATICSSDVYDNLFRRVRRLAMEGYSQRAIQEQLDDQLGTLLNSTDSSERRCLGFPRM
jgi:hypothetical protein